MRLQQLLILGVLLVLVRPGIANERLEPGAAIDYHELAFYPERWRARQVSTRLIPWQGQHVVLLTTTADYDPAVMARFVARLDAGWQLYRNLVGQAPRLHRHLDGKTTIAAVPDTALTCGGACGYIGATGIEVGYFYKLDYPGILKHPRSFSHYHFYEMGRNYFVFGDRHSVYLTGFAVFMRYVCMDTLQCEDQDAPTRRTIEQCEDLYARSNLTFLTTFTNVWGDNVEHTHRLTTKTGAPLAPSDANCMYASVMLKLRRDYGGDAWVKRFCHTLRACPEVAPAGKEGAMRQNINWLVAASAAARTNLAPLFVERYRMPLARATRDALAAVDWATAENDPAAIIRGLPMAFELADVVRVATHTPGSQVCAHGEIPKAILPMGERLLVVNQAGEVWAHHLADSVGNAVRVAGAKVCPNGENPKAIFPMGSRIMVVNREGEVWAHAVGDSIGEAQRLLGSKVCAGGEIPKAIFAMHSLIVVVNQQGEVWAHRVAEEVGQTFRLEGSKVCADGEVPKTILPFADKIVVINRFGQAWAHRLTDRVGTPYRLEGALVCGHGEIPTAIVARPDRVVVVNRQGDVWTHRLR